MSSMPSVPSTSSTSERPSIWSFQDNFDFRSDISAKDKFHYPLENHRGDYNRRTMLAHFSLSPQGALRTGTTAKTNQVVLFGGHIGCGKSTELRDFEELFGRFNAYTVSRMESTKQLDINNLRFSDLLIMLAHELVKTFEREDLELQPEAVFIDPVIHWFETRIRKKEQFADLEGEIKTEIKAKAGIPWLAEFLATISSKVRGGVSYRDELRTEIRNGFTTLRDHFNALIAHANTLLKHQGHGPLLFIIDGIDKLSKENADTFFGGDVEQLLQIQTNLILCAPIHILVDNGTTMHRFPRVRLPMVKIYDADESPRPDEENALIALVEKRMPLDYFDSTETVRYLVQQSGGHVRDLLRLVNECFLHIDEAPITRAIAERAVRKMAVDYQRLVRDSWAELVQIDVSQGEEIASTDERMRLLLCLVLLEYNNYWWRSHPLVRTLPAYKKALAAAPTTR